MDLEVARTPRTLCPFQLMTLPPAASTLSSSSGLSGCGTKDKGVNRKSLICLTFKMLNMLYFLITHINVLNLAVYCQFTQNRKHF